MSLTGPDAAVNLLSPANNAHIMGIDALIDLHRLNEEEIRVFTAARWEWERIRETQPPATDWNVLKCLLAAKWHLSNALQLLQRYMELCGSLHLVGMTVQTVLPVLQSKKYALAGVDNMGHSIFLVRASMHVPDKFNLDDEMRAMIYLLDYAAATNPMTMRHGVTILVDTRDFARKNFDKSLLQKIANTFQGRYPLRVRHIVMYKPTLLLKGVIGLIKPIFKSSTVKKIVNVDEAGLRTYAEPSQLPRALGGTLHFNINEWIRAQQDLEEGTAFHPSPLQPAPELHPLASPGTSAHAIVAAAGAGDAPPAADAGADGQVARKLFDVSDTEDDPLGVTRKQSRASPRKDAAAPAAASSPPKGVATVGDGEESKQDGTEKAKNMEGEAVKENADAQRARAGSRSSDPGSEESGPCDWRQEEFGGEEGAAAWEEEDMNYTPFE